MGYTMTDEQAAALTAWKKLYGRGWKAKLQQAWETGNYSRFPEAGALQQLRNQAGPAWLAKAKVEGVETGMRQLIERVEEKTLKDPNTSAWVAENLAKFAEECAEHATEVYKGPGSVYPGKWYRKLDLDMKENGYGPLNAQMLGLFSEAYEKFMSVIGSLPGSKNYQNYKLLPGITKDITDRALALAR